MSNDELKNDLAEVMAGIEEMISQHYKAYAEKFKENQDFWLRLVAEELDHAQWIRELYSKTKTGPISFDEQRFNKKSLQEFSSRLKNMLNIFVEQSASIKEALKNSLKIESLVLESKFFEVFKTDAPELKKVLEHLAQATREHRERIEQFLGQFK
jgi:rubrerythrin